MPQQVFPPDISVVEMRHWLMKNNYQPVWQPITPDMAEAKIRVQLFRHRTGMPTGKIASMLGTSHQPVSKWLKTYAFYPDPCQAKKILSLISEDGELLPS